MDALSKPIDLFKKVKELGQPAVGISDHGCLTAAWDCLKASKATGVKLIMGCEFYFTADFNSNDRLRHIILLAKNHQGYKNLLMLNKLANDNHIIAFKRTFPRINWELLEQYSEGLICTTACGGGILGHLINTRRAPQAKEEAKKLKGIFGDDLALEIQPHHLRRNTNNYNDYEDQRLVNNTLIKFGQELDIKVIAATNSHYINKEQAQSHDVLLAIGAGQPVKSGQRLKYETETSKGEFYVKSRQEVRDFFARLYPKLADQFCDNTLYFADKCEQPDWIDPKFTNPSGNELPDFPVKDQPDYQDFLIWSPQQPQNIQNKNEDSRYLRYSCFKNFKCPPGQEQTYTDRLEYELDVFEVKNLSSYMLIVADYVNWAKNNQIPVGPSRGSGGSSLAGYFLNIHEIDSIKYNLIFERFYNKLKTGLSDLDLDFSQEGKPLVEKYIQKKYGLDYCAAISNYSTLTPKPYVKAISRVFQFGGDQKAAVAIGNAIADSIPKEYHTVTKAIAEAPLLAEYANSEKYSAIKIFAKDIGNTSYNFSTHAGAIIISRRPLAEIVPIRKSKEGDYATEYEKERAEDNGLAKMDILGVSTLDIIDNTIKIIKSRNKSFNDNYKSYDIYDEKTYKLISEGDTYGVFQFGKSGGTIDLCKKMQPRNIEDLAMINAMTRPGFPKEVREDFIAVKKGLRKFEVAHPVLEKAFAPTFGFPLYDEVLLQLAKDYAGWDYAEADRLRKFVKDKGKHPDKDKKLKEDMIASAIKNGLSEATAYQIWNDVISKFAAYSFNKAHSVGYSFLAYQTAYLKAHYPLEFLIANLQFQSASNAQDSDKNIEIAKSEIRNLNVKILPPNINTSANTYLIIDDNTVLSGLDSLKFMGKDAIPEIIAKRPFTSLEDFLSKVDGRKVKAPAVQALAAAGCLDHFGLPRKAVFLYAADYKQKLQVFNKKNTKGTFNYPWPAIEDWSIAEKYAMEVKYIGEGLTGTYFDAYPSFFQKNCINFNDLPAIFNKVTQDKTQSIPLPYTAGPLQGVLKSMFEFKVKKEGSKIFGETMSKLTLQDPYGNHIAVTVFPKELKRLLTRLREISNNKVKLEPGVALEITGAINWYEGEISIIFDNLINCAGIPPLPKDLEKKKVSMKITSGKKKGKTQMEILEEIEDEMIEEGLIDDIFDQEESETDE